MGRFLKRVALKLTFSHISPGTTEMQRFDLLNDFATLFAYNWYRDFPMDGYNRDMGSLSDWNIHTGITVRRVGDLLGFFTHFESSNRTDAVVRDAQRSPILFAEWEWIDPSRQQIGEPKKLSDAALAHNPQFCFLFSYVLQGSIECAHQFIAENWKAQVPLLVSLIEYTGITKRTFHQMSMHQLHNGQWTLLREQPALAWALPGTRWQL